MNLRFLLADMMFLMNIQGWGQPSIPGWWYTYPSEKYEFVSWDHEIPNIWKNIKSSKPPTIYTD